MNVTERVAELRKLMAEKNIDAYIVPSADFHQSEYVGGNILRPDVIFQDLPGLQGRLSSPRATLAYGLTAGILYRLRHS